MNQLKIPFVLVFVLFVCGLTWASGGHGGDYGSGSTSRGRGLAQGHQNGHGNGRSQGFQGSHGNGGPQGFQGGQGGRRGRGYEGGSDEGFGGAQGWNGRQSNGGQGGKKYRSNLYNDDDVYGYDATYPNGEVAYINYKSKDARARRGPEFARTSTAYSRQGGNGGGSANLGQRNEYKSGGGGGGEWNCNY